MEGGAACFRDVTPFVIQVKGSINGTKFTIEGKGTGDARNGQTDGKFVCTTGKLPMSWAALAGTLGNGYKCFANYPNGVPHFFQECMPDGYVQERITRYPDDGILRTYHEVTYSMGVVMNRVTLLGEGFKQGSPVLDNGLKCFLPNTESTYPFENGIRSLTHHVFPLKSSSGYIVATQTTVNRPLTNKKLITLPSYHFTRSECMQRKDVDDERDHIIQNEVLEGFEMKLLYERD